MSRYAPNARALNLAYQLEQLAPQITAAIDHVRMELTIADSYPTQTPGASTPTATGSASVCRCGELGGDGCDVCTPQTYTATERAAFARFHLANQREQIRDDITCLEETIASLAKTLRLTLGTRTPTNTQKLCDCSGHEGAELARADGGWSDPTCEDLADKAGLCNACYMRKRRYLIRIGNPPRNEIEAA